MNRQVVLHLIFQYELLKSDLKNIPHPLFKSCSSLLPVIGVQYPEGLFIVSFGSDSDQPKWRGGILRKKDSNTLRERERGTHGHGVKTMKSPVSHLQVVTPQCHLKVHLLHQHTTNTKSTVTGLCVYKNTMDRWSMMWTVVPYCD